MGIETLWWIGLAGAVVGWLVLLKLVLVAHRILGHICVVARMTRDTARSISVSMRAVSELPAVDRSATELGGRIVGLVAALRGLEETVESLPGVRAGSVR